MAAPIRIAIIGLSASATGTGWAAAAHLPYLRKSPHYTIVALCNSNLTNAQAAIRAFNLPPETKAYGSPEDLANDQDVDLVVVNTRVDLHAKVLLPSIRKGKDVFCEWPLDRNEAVAREILEAAREGGGKTVVGLQGRFNPVVNKVKCLIEEGRIGKVLSSTLVGMTGNSGADESVKVRYMNERKVGGNILTIHFGHTIDWLLHTLGEIDTASTLLATQRRESRIIDGWDTRKYIETMKRDTPDQIMLQATLKTGPVISLHLRGGGPMPLGPRFLWRIYGDKGEIDVSASGMLLNSGYDDSKVSLHDHETGKVEEIPVEKDEWDELPLYARNIGRLYEAFRLGDKTKLPTVEEAYQRHVLIDKMLKHWDDGDQGWKV